MSTTYDQDALLNLRHRTEYEVWLLQAVYEIANKAHLGLDEMIYPANGGAATLSVHAQMNFRLNDWRPGFLQAGAPLVLVTAFKLLDMLLEWVLDKNGIQGTYKFGQKITALKRSSIGFPPLIETRPWLRERLVALYEAIDPLRGTIIHDRYFTSAHGELQVSSSRGGVVGAAVTISETDLRSLSRVLVSLLRYLEGTWTMDVFHEKLIRGFLDDLAHLHGLALLGQSPPRFLTVRIYAPDSEPISWDLENIRKDVDVRQPGHDVIFDLRIVTVSRGAVISNAYLVPWSQLQADSSKPSKTRADLAHLAVAPPADCDLVAIARDLYGV